MGWSADEREPEADPRGHGDGKAGGGSHGGGSDGRMVQGTGGTMLPPESANITATRCAVNESDAC